MKLTRLLIILPIIAGGFLPPLVDFGITHVQNPDWPGHARYHTLWMLFEGMAIATVSLAIIYKKYPTEALGLRIGGLMGLCIYLAFFAALLSKDFFGATLSDEGGMPTTFGIDANLMTFTPLSILLLIGIYRSFYKEKYK